ncbi:MAG: extracellular solute-binding protein [Firmicutes bacterium]|nr:extracellular solute-binding protein [Bacillota bacterium]
MKKSLSLVLILALWVAVSSIGGAHWLDADYDFGGETVTIVEFWGGGPFNDGAGAAHLEAIEEKYNCVIEFGWPGGDHNAFVENLATYVMEGAENVVFEGQNQWIYYAAAEGLLLPLTDVLDQGYYDALPGSVGSVMPEHNNFFGEVYGFECGWMGGPDKFFQETQAIYWNKELFERENLPDPYELYANGEWTWENFKDIAIKATADTDGDGEIDQWGYTSRGTMNEPGTIEYFVYMNGGEPVRFEDERLLFTMNEPAAIEALEFASEMVDLGVYLDYGIWGPWQEGNVAMNINIPSELYGTHENHFINQVNFEFGYLPLPKGPRADEHVAVNRLTCFGVLPLTAKNPEALIALYHDLYEFTKYQEPFTYGPVYNGRAMNARSFNRVEDMYWNDTIGLNVPDMETYETLMWMNENVTAMGPFELYFAVDGYVETIEEIVNGEIPPETGIAEIRPMVQSFLDELFRH